MSIRNQKFQNERFHRVGDWDGKEPKAKKEKVRIFQIKVVFDKLEDFDHYYETVERTMEQSINETNVKCRADRDMKTLIFSRENDERILKETSRQIKLITKGWRRKMKKALQCKNPEMNHKIETSFSQGIILIELR